LKYSRYSSYRSMSLVAPKIITTMLFKNTIAII